MDIKNQLATAGAWIARSLGPFSCGGSSVLALEKQVFRPRYRPNPLAVTLRNAPGSTQDITSPGPATLRRTNRVRHHTWFRN
ncbi:hypothetical protein quinque_013713 [Culex quinquefasciatus]